MVVRKVPPMDGEQRIDGLREVATERTARSIRWRCRLWNATLSAG